MYPELDIYDGDEVVIRNRPVVLPYTAPLKVAEHDVNEFAIKLATEYKEGTATSLPIVARKFDVVPPGLGLMTLLIVRVTVLT